VLNGTTVAVRSSGCSLVEHLKALVECHTSIPPAHQRLIFAGRQLEDSKALSFYGLSSEQTVHLVLRLYGGGGSEVCQFSDVQGLFEWLEGLKLRCHIANTTFMQCFLIHDLNQFCICNHAFVVQIVVSMVRKQPNGAMTMEPPLLMKFVKIGWILATI